MKANYLKLYKWSFCFVYEIKKIFFYKTLRTNKSTMILKSFKYNKTQIFNCIYYLIKIKRLW